MPFVSQPYAPPSMYDPRHGGDRIVDLMLRQGDISARGAAAQGDIWGHTVANVGSQVGQIVMQQQEQKAQEKRAQAINDTIQSWDGQNVPALFKQLAPVVGPEDALKLTNGMVGLSKLSQQQDKPDFEAFHHAVSGAAALLSQGGDAAVAQHWDTLKSALGPGALSIGYQLPDQYTPEVGKVLTEYDKRFNKTTTDKEESKPGSEGWYLKLKFGDKQPTAEEALQARHEFAASARETPKTLEQIRAEHRAMAEGSMAGGGGEKQDDVKLAVTAMKEGMAPPLLPGRATKEYLATIAEAKRQGFDLASANMDWLATSKHLATLNGAQQTRLRQAVDTASHSLDVIEDLAKQWQGGKFPLLNKGQLAAAKAGALGPKAQSIATRLEAQISDVTSELGNVYMGGNSPTDHALSLAAKNLSADWTQSQLIDAIDLSRKNLKIRSNSMVNVGVAGASEDNPYAPPAAAAPAARPTATNPKTGQRIEWDGTARVPVK